MPISPKNFGLELFILVFEICAIIHQQLVALLRRVMRFVYRAMSRSAELFPERCKVSLKNILYVRYNELESGRSEVASDPGE